MNITYSWLRRAHYERVSEIFGIDVQMLREYLNDAHVAGRIVWVNDRIVGAALFNPHDGLLEIEYFHIQAEHRRKGYGTQLMRDVMHRSNAGLVNFPVDMDNTDALMFLKAIGFQLSCVDAIRQAIMQRAYPCRT